MTTYTDLHLAISDKLGWSAMLASVAIPAIDRIIEGFILWNVSCGHSREEMIPNGDYTNLWNAMNRFSSDEIFAYIVLTTIDDMTSRDRVRPVIYLRAEIEYEMKVHNLQYDQALYEWDVWKQLSIELTVILIVSSLPQSSFILGELLKDSVSILLQNFTVMESMSLL